MSLPAEIVLLPDERLVWSGRPERLPYALSGLALSLIGAAWLVLPLLTWRDLRAGKPVASAVPRQALELALLAAILFGLLLVATPLYRAWRQGRVFYALSDRRVFLLEGPAGLAVLRLSQVKGVALEQRWFERIFGTATIHFWCGEMIVRRFVGPRYHSFRFLAQAPQVFAQIEELLERTGVRP
ncbi:MAG TPA: PH domain-containing protein [Thermoanaerobaculia bacterium]|nr:PH domain-containing protein [Thermoanaerobaculia bacterium]